VLNSDGDIRFIAVPGERVSEAPESAAEDAGLSRPVPLSVDSDPLPLWLTSVVMKLNREGARARMGRRTPGNDNSTGVFIGHLSFSISQFPFDR